MKVSQYDKTLTKHEYVDNKNEIPRQNRGLKKTSLSPKNLIGSQNVSGKISNRSSGLKLSMSKESLTK